MGSSGKTGPRVFKKFQSLIPIVTLEDQLASNKD